MFSVMATSVGRRSIDEAPKKPTILSAVEDILGVVGLGGPSVAEHDDFLVDADRRRHGLDLDDATSSVLAVCALMVRV